MGKAGEDERGCAESIVRLTLYVYPDGYPVRITIGSDEMAGKSVVHTSLICPDLVKRPRSLKPPDLLLHVR